MSNDDAPITFAKEYDVVEVTAKDSIPEFTQTIPDPDAPFLMFEKFDKTATIDFKDGRLVFEGDLTVDEAVETFFGSVWSQLMLDAACQAAIRDATIILRTENAALKEAFDMTLTTPQRRLLMDIKTGDALITNKKLKTAGALVEKGLCIWGEKRLLILTGAGMVITAGTK